MKRILSLLLAAVLLTLTAIPAAASTEPTVEQKAVELEKKYGINILYPTDSRGEAIITTGSLTTLDMALETVTPGIIKQVSDYFKERNGDRITLSYKQSTRVSGSEMVLAGFDPKTSLIELYFPRSGSAIFATGENPISIVHEFGHAFHTMCTDQYGVDKMRKEWSAFNGGISYKESNLETNPDENAFISAYASSAFAEDFAETFAHVFIRNRAGQGFKSRMTSGGSQTGLGKKVAYVERMLSLYLKDADTALANYRKIYSTATTVTYQSMKFSGDYLQYAGYPQPRYVLNGALKELGVTKNRAIWIRSIGGWYVQDTRGREIIVFPGGSWCEVSKKFVAPTSA